MNDPYLTDPYHHNDPYLFPNTEFQYFAVRSIIDRDIYLADYGFEEPGIDVAIVFESRCNPSTCIVLSDGTRHLGRLVTITDMSGITHKFRVVTDNVWMLRMSYEDFKAIPERSFR